MGKEFLKQRPGHINNQVPVKEILLPSYSDLR